jgi:hypothetical protein
MCARRCSRFAPDRGQGAHVDELLGKPRQAARLQVAGLEQTLVGPQELQVVLGQDAMEVLDVSALADHVLQERLRVTLHMTPLLAGRLP